MRDYVAKPEKLQKKGEKREKKERKKSQRKYAVAQCSISTTKAVM